MMTSEERPLTVDHIHSTNSMHWPTYNTQSLDFVSVSQKFESLFKTMDPLNTPSERMPGLQSADSSTAKMDPEKGTSDQAQDIEASNPTPLKKIAKTFTSRSVPLIPKYNICVRSNI